MDTPLYTDMYVLSIHSFMKEKFRKIVENITFCLEEQDHKENNVLLLCFYDNRQNNFLNKQGQLPG